MAEERKIHVRTADRKEYLGIGVYLGDTTRRAEVELGLIEGPLEGIDAVFAHEVIPKIRLESGVITYGFACWWTDLTPAWMA